MPFGAGPVRSGGGAGAGRLDRPGPLSYEGPLGAGIP